MKFKDIKQFLSGLEKSFLIRPSIHLFGGEPLLHKEFLDVLKDIKRRRLKCTLTTNGIRLKKFANELAEIGVDFINVSIDGPEHIHDAGRGLRGGFRKAVDGISELAAKKTSKKPIINVNCTITSMNYLQLEDIVKLFQAMEINSLTFQHLVFSQAEAEEIRKWDLGTLTQEIADIKKGKYKIPVIFCPNIKTKDIVHYYGDYSYPFANKCLRPWLVPTIMPNGEFWACRAPHQPFGNVSTRPLRDMWNSKESRAFRERINKNGIFHDTCIRCCHRQYY